MLSGISSSLNGLYDATTRLASSAQKIANGNPTSASTDTKTNINAAANVNLDEEIVNAKFSEVLYGANAKVLKAQLDTEKKLLDILA